jgi:carbon storage regulator CsrA
MGLVVERLPRQAVMIGDGIEVVLLTVHGERVQIGVVAPPGMRVERAEVDRRPQP